MYKLETCHRAVVNPRRRKKRVRISWEGRLPNQKEYDERDLDDQTWFQATSSLISRLPSAVLVENVIVKHAEAQKKPKSKGQMSTGKGKGDVDSGKTTSAKTGDSDGIVRRLELSTEGFWEFLHSDRWEDTCLLRVLKGGLLNNLLFALQLLQKDHDVISYVTIAYLNENFKVVPSMKNPTIGETLETPIQEVLVELDYFCPMQKPTKKELGQLGKAGKLTEDEPIAEIPEEKPPEPEDIPPEKNCNVPPNRSRWKLPRQQTSARSLTAHIFGRTSVKVGQAFGPKSGQ